jgi:biotin carboxylase
MTMPTVLLVHAKSGPPPSHAISKVAAVAPTHLLAITPLPSEAARAAARYCSSVTDVSAARLSGEPLVDQIVSEARRHRADAVVTMSEFAQIAVSAAAVRLGLRGVGPNVVRARNKRLMRSVWAVDGLPVPRWQSVDSVDDVFRAWGQMTPPILLKSAWSAAAVGQVLIRDRSDIEHSWVTANSGMQTGQQSWFSELSMPSTNEFIADEIIPATTRGWYDDARLGDHISVEGLVIDGRYHPICITSKPRTITPFTERGNFTPCVLPEPLQRQVEEMATRAVDALNLDTCGTHTELKLLADHELCLLETAARFGGVMVTREVETVYGIDMIGALVRALLGQPPEFPDRMLTSGGRGAAGSVAMYAVDSHGKPWTTLPVFRLDNVDWSELISPGTRVEVVPDLTLPSGSPMPPYDPGNGYLNSAGLLFVTADSAANLIDDAHSIMDGLEGVLTR